MLHLRDLLHGSAARKRHAVIVGDMNIALTDLDHSKNSRVNGPCSTIEERMFLKEVLDCGYTDTYRFMNPETIDFTCSSAFPGWKANPNSQPNTSKRIDLILTTPRIKILAANIDHGTTLISDHSAAIATIELSPIKVKPQTSRTQPTISIKQTTAEHKSTLSTIEVALSNSPVICSLHSMICELSAPSNSLNATMSDIPEVISQLQSGKINLPYSNPPVENAPEDQNVPHTDMPQAWKDAISEITRTEKHNEYIDLIQTHTSPVFFAHPRCKEVMLSHDALKTWGEGMDSTGITGIPPLQLQFRTSDMPLQHRAKLRPVPIALRPAIEKHIEKYIDQELLVRSPQAQFTSPTVIAAKKTHPFFRMAVDYRWINEYIVMIQSYVPIILDELHKANGWVFFGDIDWREAFHQVLLEPKTSEMLSIITILGPLKPRFMMEGVSPASNVLQNIVAEIFNPIRNESICAFDNILTGGETLDDLFDRVVKILQICCTHNVKLNFSKTFLGFTKAKFFGYEIDKTGYRIDESRKSALTKIPFPGYGKTKKENTKLMRSFLGFSVYFIHFVENYAKHAAPLHDMTHDTFDWDKSTWVRDYESDFNNFKERLSTSMDVIFPDFALEWIVLPDASDLAVGWIILQLRPMADTSLRAEPISIGSEKLSPVARRWPINEKEGYALVRSVRSNSNLLATKPFLIASDHWNLSYIETNPSAKVQRYLLALQEFPVKGCLMIDMTTLPQIS